MKLVANELIPVYETDQSDRVVDGRELHQFLEVGRDFTSWMKDRIERYGFEEGIDFTLTLTKTGERSNVIKHDYFLQLDTAKQIAMVESNEQGSKVRKYFIEVERRFKQQSIDVTQLTPELQMFKHMFDAQAKTQLQLQVAQKEIEEVRTTMNTIQETFLQRDDDWRKSINSMLNSAAYRSGGAYRDLRSKSYEMLESRGSCDLNRRLRNMRDRLAESGATKSKIEATGRMDVIEADSKLKEIYTTIVKELSIGSLRIAK